MNDNLQWLAKNMPKGWKLSNPCDSEHWHVLERIDKGARETPAATYGVYTDGDVGLAPLTALLKQELVKHSRTVGEEHIMVRYRFGAWQFNVYRGYDTEFEAVLMAYRKTKNGK